MNDKKVSIITPVYNGEEYIERYLNSVINQTYKNIELIIIDDGSTDETKNKIHKYIYNSSNVNIKYIYQKNGGQASAVANGLNHVTGKYLVGADSDDYFELDAIEKMVCFIESKEKASIIRCNAVARDEKNNKILRKLVVPKEYEDTQNFFEDLIYVRGINAFTGIYMMDFEKYKKNNPNLMFYNSREGQNWQLLLPASYRGNCFYLNEIVYNYIIRENSHSHSVRTLQQNETRINELRKILKNTLNYLDIDFEYKNKLFNDIDNMYNKKLYILYCKAYEKEKVKQLYKKIKDKGIKEYIAYIIGTNKLVNRLFMFCKRGEIVC